MSRKVHLKLAATALQRLRKALSTLAAIDMEIWPFELFQSE